MYLLTVDYPTVLELGTKVHSVRRANLDIKAETEWRAGTPLVYSALIAIFSGLFFQAHKMTELKHVWCLNIVATVAMK